MTPHPSATAMDIAQTVFETRLGRQFHRAAREFVEVLRTVPGGAPDEMSGGAIQVLRHLAERVIEQSNVASRVARIDRLCDRTLQPRHTTFAARSRD